MQICKYFIFFSFTFAFFIYMPMYLTHLLLNFSLILFPFFTSLESNKQTDPTTKTTFLYLLYFRTHLNTWYENAANKSSISLQHKQQQQLDLKTKTRRRKKNEQLPDATITQILKLIFLIYITSSCKINATTLLNKL